VSIFVQPHAGKITKEQVKIYCPSCEFITTGEIEGCENFPFNSYFAECHTCGYLITESEWNEVKEQGCERTDAA